MEMKKVNVKLEGKTILVTGAAGFIGANLVRELLETVPNVTVVGLDNCNDYYDVSLKEYRLKQLEETADVLDKDQEKNKEEDKANKNKSQWIFLKGSIADKALVTSVFETYRPAVVVNLAAQAGVR